MAERRSRYSYDREYYERLNRNAAYDGNAARRLASFDDLYDEAEEAEILVERPGNDGQYIFVPEEQPVGVPRRAPKPGRALKVKRRPAYSIMHLAIVTALIGLLFASAVQMIYMKSEITQVEKQIRKADAQLKDVQALNESLSSGLDAEPDRNYIYSVAVGRLGMAYPNANDVIYYEVADTDYVRQYSVIR